MEKVNEAEARRILIKKMLLRQGMTKEARERLARVKLANPTLAEKAEIVCLQLIQQGRMIDEELLKKILAKLSSRREIRIRRW